MSEKIRVNPQEVAFEQLTNAGWAIPELMDPVRARAILLLRHPRGSNFLLPKAPDNQWMINNIRATESIVLGHVTRSFPQELPRADHQDSFTLQLIDHPIGLIIAQIHPTHYSFLQTPQENPIIERMKQIVR